MATPASETVIEVPFGRLAIWADVSGVREISLVDARSPLAAPTGAMARRVCDELQAYFDDASHVFALPVYVDGSAFQKRVWQALRGIDAGVTTSYGELARRLKTSARAIGGACRANPVPIIVPCHRVIAANGQGGFMGVQGGAPAKMKHWLLEHEAR